MRILFDGFWWVSGPVSNKQVMREFILAWEREFPQDELFVAVPKADLAAVREQLLARVRVLGTRLRPQGISAIVELPFIARRLKVDATLTHNFTPLFGSSAVFVHDVMFMTNPEWFTRTERAYFSLMPLTLGRARWVLSSTRTEADRITRLARTHPAVTAVGLGLSRGLSSASPVKPAGLDGAGDFLLSVGRLNARKNLGTAIEAAIASGVATPSTPLVIVGEPGGKAAELPPLVAAAVASGAVRFLGFIDDDELAWLYTNAGVFLFLSLDEGFGMPTLEAAQFGVPVVASDIAVFREILGPRAHYVPPHDVQAIAEAIRVAFDAGRTAPVDVEELGYSWELSARRIRTALSAG
jgi:glycosyltransferase involved in cell wall biosynthesis